MMIPKKLNIFSRFGAIWTPNFLQYLKNENRSGPTWGFWFLWNTIFTIVGAVAFYFWGGPYLESLVMDFKTEIFEKYGDFEFKLEDGEFSTTLPEPIKINDETGNFVFVLDTEGQEYDESILKNYSDGIFINKDRIVSKQNNFKKEEILFSEFAREDFEFNNTDIEQGIKEFLPVFTSFFTFFILIFGWIFLSLFRLLTALWWGLLFWIVGMLLEINKWDFPTAYLAVLNFYFIPLIIESILFFSTGFAIPFGTTLIFGIVFGMNFWHLTHNHPPDNQIDVKSNKSGEDIFSD